MPSTAINSPRRSPSAASVLPGDYFCPPMYRALPVTARVVLTTTLDPIGADTGVRRELVGVLGWGVW